MVDKGNLESYTQSVCGNAPMESGGVLMRQKDGSQSSLGHGISGNEQGPGRGLGDTYRPWTEQANVWKKSAHVRIDWEFEEADGNKGDDVHLNLNAIRSNQERLEKALVGKLLGRKVPFAVLLGELRRRWQQFGNFHLIMTGDDYFTCLFDSVEARDTVLMGGPWYVGGYIIGLDRWTLTFSPNSLQGLSTPIWVRFSFLSLLYWDNDNLARIASKIGTPLWIDAQTSSWSRGSYARVCVRIYLSKRLPKGVWISGINGCFFQKVEYEGLSSLCFHCGVIGHLETKCPSRATQSGGHRLSQSMGLPSVGGDNTRHLGSSSREKGKSSNQVRSKLGSNKTSNGGHPRFEPAREQGIIEDSEHFEEEAGRDTDGDIHIWRVYQRKGQRSATMIESLDF